MDKQIVLKATDTVKKAVELIDKKRIRAVFIVDEDTKLLGIFTQGDLRKYILKNGKIDGTIAEAMNRYPKVFKNIEEAREGIIVAPIVDQDGRLIDVLNNGQEEADDVKKNVCLRDVPLVIMAGGMGTRLFPLTKILPKALIPIGEYTIIERIINNFVSWGCKDVYVVINYKGDMIRTYLEDKAKEYRIHFVQEEEFLGTGGGLALLKGRINSTFILSNCDILVETDFECVLKTHRKRKYDITFIGAYMNTQIPYGVIQTDEEGVITGLTEKPEISFLTNAGVYVIEPEIVDSMPMNTFCHMTDLAMNCMQNGKKVGVFPVSSNAWQDMGQIDEMKSMIKTFEK